MEIRKDLLKGVTVNHWPDACAKSERRRKKYIDRKNRFVAIPYYARAHRGEDGMNVVPNRLNLSN